MNIALCIFCWVNKHFRFRLLRDILLISHGSQTGLNQTKLLCNKVKRAASKLMYNCSQTQIAAINESGSHVWWIHMKT